MIIASILKDVVLFLFIIKLVIDTIIGKLKMYPPVGPKRTPIPPLKPVNTGKPIIPMNK